MVKKKDSDPNALVVEPYGLYKMLPRLDKVLLRYSQDNNESYDEYKDIQDETTQDIFGVNEPKRFTFNPSTSSVCVRKEGYRAYGYKPEPSSIEGIIITEIGKAAHRQLLNIFRRYIEKSRAEVDVISESPPISGRLDLLVYNHLVKEYQVLDLKFIGIYPFKKLGRSELPQELLSTKDIYKPSPDYEDQILYYVWAQRQKGIDVTCANIIYFDRDSGKRKEALIPWDARAEARVANFIENKIKPADILINEDLHRDIPREEKRLPEPSVELDYLCGYCNYLKYCVPGQKIGREGLGHLKKERAPRWVAKTAQERAEKMKEKAERLQISQPNLL